jgi:hypothetical protein
MKLEGGLWVAREASCRSGGEGGAGEGSAMSDGEMKLTVLRKLL